MARLARHYVPDQPQHVILQGLAGPAFMDEGDYLYFLACVADAARVADLAVHAWVLMPDAVQFLVTPSYESSVAMAMQAVGRRYAETFNRRHGRRGAVWRGEYRSTVIEPDRYFLLASQVIDQAPVRNGLAAEPGNYPWSSCAHHIGLRVDRFIKDHPLYRALGNTPFERHQAYRDLGAQPVDEREINNLMQSTLNGWVLGSPAYCEWAAQTANRRLMPLLLRDRPSTVRTTRSLVHVG
ncbi:MULTISPECIES: transposase [unclassified Paraburkholderia]|uniref:transposase n=1 Tax=unclassified Paraburkholderia TaxID=2615204 RepID=UPI00160990F7|nr:MULTISPECIES: transposase [unclassified Paraburkholderia]MBB5413616.1 putative transposase [Paraburkholderia sp. HC6.4b]MBB5456024.1 putative transposase [Paraburkholderia sp. Kb1A]